MTYESRPPSSSSTPRGGFFAWVRSLGIARDNGWLGGVCSGLADRLMVRPSIVRLIAVILAFFAGSAILVYLALWLVLPDRDNNIHLENMLNGR